MQLMQHRLVNLIQPRLSLCVWVRWEEGRKVPAAHTSKTIKHISWNELVGIADSYNQINLQF